MSVLYSTGWAVDRCPELKSIGVGSHGPEPSPWTRHDELWSLHLYRYSGVLETDRGRQGISPGLLSVLPPGVAFRRCYQAAHAVHIFALFRCEPAEADGGRVPWVVQLGDDFAEINAWLEQAVGLFPIAPLRAALRVWDVVLRLLDLGETDRNPREVQGDWLVDRFVEWVEPRLSETPTLEQAIQAMGCSYTHLNEHVRRRLGCSVKKYIRRRQIERAVNLMKYSPMSVKEVAMSLGFESLQAFNQFVHREAGVAPRELRRGIRSRETVRATECRVRKR